MIAANELIRITLIALALGLAIPVLVQFFLTLRQMQKSMSRIEQRLDPTLRDLSDVLASMKSGPAPSQASSLLAAAVVPAVVAAIRAFRTSVAVPEATPRSNGVEDPKNLREEKVS